MTTHLVPDDLDGRSTLVLDPMLATGGSLAHTVSLLRESNAGAITVACVLTCPEGVQFMDGEHPDVDIYSASIDAALNEVSFIRPGLGDTGDRQFGLS